MNILDRIKGFMFGHSPAALANKYAYHAKYSRIDGCHIAVCPKFKGLIGYGQTHLEATVNIKKAVAQTIEEYLEMGAPLP